MNLFIGVILDGFDEAGKEETDIITQEDFSRFARNWEEFDPRATCLMSIHVSWLPEEYKTVRYVGRCVGSRCVAILGAISKLYYIDNMVTYGPSGSVPENKLERVPLAYFWKRRKLLPLSGLTDMSKSRSSVTRTESCPTSWRWRVLQVRSREL